MKFMRQIGFEAKNIFRSKFILIMGILVLVLSLFWPAIQLLEKNRRYSWNGPGPRPYYSRDVYEKYAVAAAAGISFDGKTGEEAITVEDVTISADNPFYWNVRSMMEEKERIEVDKSQFKTPEALDIMLALMDQEIHYYVVFAKSVTSQNDYRTQLAWGNSLDTLYDKFFYENSDKNLDALLEVHSMRKGLDEEAFKKKYISITAEERQKAIAECDGKMTELFNVVESNDFGKYVELRIAQENAQIKSFQDTIALFEKQIVETPSQEDTLNAEIENLRTQIRFIEENNIPILQLRLNLHIVPGEDTWQNTAVSDIENNRSQLLYNTIKEEADFLKEQYLVQEYGNYSNYLDKMQKLRNGYTNNILIAERSLNAEKPDMKYIEYGARSVAVGSLFYYVFVAMFAVMLGGWIIASEYQQGTIRLLMIRPKNRLKILAAKFVAAFALCLGIYLAGTLLNTLASGIFFGFSDYSFPNYTVSGEVSFALYYLPKFLMCIVPLFFGFTFAFMLSVLIRNSAVSIVVPIICFIGCFFVMVLGGNMMSWLAWTPVPYVQIFMFFDNTWPLFNYLQNGYTFSMPYGLGILMVLAAACTMVAMLVFKKRDITN